MTDLLHVVATYVPTELIALYVAFCGAVAPAAVPASGVKAPVSGATTTGDTTTGSAQTATTPELTATYTEWIGWIVFVVATPLFVWILFAGKLKKDGKAIPWSPHLWPVWEMSAATTAFVAWSYALPGGVFARGFANYSAALAGLSLLFVSTIIGLLAPLFQRPLKT